MRNFLYFFGQLLYVPHIILFLFSKEKENILSDINYLRVESQSIWWQIYYLSKQLLVSKYYRTLFYFRLGGFLSKILRIFYPKDNSFIIDKFTKLGKGVKLAHPYSTILNAECIGENLYVNHLVTVGEKNGKKPIIGNNVSLNAGCIVIGGISLGDNVVVGAGAVVVKDVPQNAIVVGNPARIISYQ